MVMDNGELVRLKNAVTERDHATGPSSAPVTLVEYGNFECIHCGRLYPVLKDIRDLLREQLRFVYRHFPTVQTHPHSLRAAEAAEAAGAQERFWEMHDHLFTHQNALEDADLARYARRVGLDTETFARDMAEHTFLKQIEIDYNLSIFDEHVTGTPTIYLNSVRYTGANDHDSLLLAIKAADTEGRIRLPERGTRLRRLFGRLTRDDNG
jgi:protein-disulfide isomerase